ncbi:MAG: hypothetical protein JST32_13145 [Bacteroidetes bacterium]|nr:hypothetical protein [Bacteroidota bacterium]
MIRNLLIIFLLLIAVCSCKRKIELKAGDLYGKWNYIKVENPFADPPDSVKHDEIVSEKPYILFTKDSLQMWWGGGILSRGSYHVSADSIHYTEVLPGGKTREFPFIVTKLEGNELVFETTGPDGSVVTTVKEK